MIYTAQKNGLLGYVDENNKQKLTEYKIHTDDVLKLQCVEKQNF